MPGGGMPGYAGGCWPDWQQMQAGGEKKKKKRKKKKQRCESSSSSSSSSSSASDWRQKAWSQSWQGQMGMWGTNMWGWPGPHQQMQPPAGGAPGWPGAPPPPSAAPGDDFGGRGSPGGHADRPVPSSASDGRFEGWGDRGGDGRGFDDRPAARKEPPSDVPIFLEPAIEEYVPVPKALLGKVIGKQAQTIIEIREKSGAFKVDARDQSTDPCQVKIAGTAEAVKKARALIMEMLDSTKLKHHGSDFVEIPRAKIGMVIGLKGAQVNEIQTQTNTKIDVDFETDPCKCYIKGERDCVDRAKKVLLTIAMQIEDEASEYIDLPRATSGAVIGAQGSRIRDFQEQSGARIDVDKTGMRCRVRLTGNPDQIAMARHLVMQEVENNLPANRPPALPPPQEPMVVPAHQPTTFPATLSESIARAKAAAEAVKNGLITTTPGSPSAGPAAPPAVVVPPPHANAGGGGQGWQDSWQEYRPW